uniref:Kinesin-like protein KIF13A n=1 Tax=Strigamia maritima TaxID=126957 RepID=T1J0U1_STRMM
MSDKVKVAVRVRPFNRREIELGTKCVVEMAKKQTFLCHPSTEKGESHKQPKNFAFDHCFWSVSENHTSYAGQDKIYENVGTDILDNAFAGYNSCIFAYGQTGSGKSYTMLGSHENKGIIPRLCDALFERMFKNDDAFLSYKVEVSYMEIYNEKVYDLLDPKGTKQTLRVREHNILGPYVDGLSVLAISSYQDIDNVMREGNKSRTVAATNMNSESSRSHAVFNIILTQILTDPASGVSGEKVAKLSLVDLAGSERAVKTGAVGERLKEGSNINKSLTTLGLVISKLADHSSGKSKDKFVPYRDSVLTWLLKDNLGGNSRTVMVATISPASDNYEETLSTLRYADRAKRIINHAVINEDPNARIIIELRAELKMLKDQLINATMQEDIHEKLYESEKLMKELSQTWEEKLHRTELIHQERQQTLEKMGISVQASGIRVEQNKYYLVNLNADPSLNELLVYYLKDKTLVGRPDAPVENDIQLSGLGIMPEHCVIIVDASDLYIEPLDGARTCVNGSVVKSKTLLRHGDRVLWGNNHFFRVNCPKLSISNEVQNEVGDTPSRPIDYEFAREELMMKEMSNDPIQAAMKALERQHEEDKQGALEKQRQMYEKQLQMLRNQMSPSTPYAPYAGFDPLGLGKLTPSTPTVQLRVEQWAQERCVSLRNECMVAYPYVLDELFKKSLAKLREDILKANALVREANCLAIEMGKQTEFGVTLQIPAANLTPNRKKSAFVSEPAILVKRKKKPSHVWSMEKLENKLIDMRDMYNECKEKGTMKEVQSKVNDPFYESQENHNLIGVANVYLTILFHDVVLSYHVPIISQQGEVAGRLHVEVCRIAEYFPDRCINYDNESALSVGSQITCRISIKQAIGLPPSLSNFVFCQYNFWGHSEVTVVPPKIDPDYSDTSNERDSLSFKFDHTKEFTISATEEFVEHCSDGALSIEVWGHQSAGFGSSRSAVDLDSQLLRSHSLADRWSELTRKIDMLVEIHELNEQGEYAPVEVIFKPENLTGGIYQLRQGQQRRIIVKVKPVQNSGTLPLICEAISSVAIGGVVARNKLQKGLDSYQDEDLASLREKWSDALIRRREHLDEQIKKIINKKDKNDQDIEREQNLIDQWVSLTEERNAVLFPGPKSGIPGEPAEGEPIPGMEKHMPVLFLDLSADDMSLMNNSDGIRVAGSNSILPKEHGTKLFNLPIVKYCEKDISACAAWDSSIHDSIHLNRITSADERIYLILKATVRLSHPATMELVLRKRLGINVYKRQTLTDRIKKRIVRQEAITVTGISYEIVSSIPKASEELEDREYLAQLAASGEDSNASDGESYIEKYTRGVSAVESILTLDKLRQEVAVKELLAAQGRSLRKTASVPNISNLLRMESPSGRLEEQFRAESIGDISSSNNDQHSRQRSNSLTKENKPNPPFIAQPAQPIKAVKPMRTLLEEQYQREVKPLLEINSEAMDEEIDDEESLDLKQKVVLPLQIAETEEEFCEFESFKATSGQGGSNATETPVEVNQNETKMTPSMVSSGYSSQAVSSNTLSSDDSLSLRSISVDEIQEIDKIQIIGSQTVTEKVNKQVDEESTFLESNSHRDSVEDVHNFGLMQQMEEITDKEDESTSAHTISGESTMQFEVENLSVENNISAVEVLQQETNTTDKVEEPESSSTLQNSSIKLREKKEKRDFSAHRASFPLAVDWEANKVESDLQTSDDSNDSSTERSSSVPYGLDDGSNSFGSEADLRRITESPLPNWMQMGESILVRPYNYSGIISFIGPTAFASGVWIGVELDMSSGKNDGSVKNVRYFACRPRHGLFVRPDKLLLDKHGRGIRARQSASFDFENDDSYGKLRRTKSKGDVLSKSSIDISSNHLRRSRSRGDGLQEKKNSPLIK